MALIPKFQGDTGMMADTALSGMAAIALYFVSFTPSLAAVPSSLGAAERCTIYSGLPGNWGKDPRAGMVHLNGGEFTLGTTLGYEEERQEVKTRVNSFWIDQTEVTVAQFAAFVKATGYVSEAEREGGGGSCLRCRAQKS